MTIPQLAEYEGENVFNPWKDSDDLDRFIGGGPEQRQQRLAAHFDCKPDYLLIGEAPGYQGCRFSGVPFTSERLIVEGKIPRVKSDRFTTRPKPWREPSATIVWGALHELGIAETTVLWNAFAWHPHKPGEPYSNRTPNRRELLEGADVLRAVMDKFKNAKCIAVGKQAKRLVDSLSCYSSFHVTEVRHPANGGARLFRQQLAAIVGKRRTGPVWCELMP